MFWRELRQALRGLGRSPATAAVAVLTLGLGIGGNTAAFSWMNALLLRPYDFPELEELVTVWEHHPRQGGGLTHHGREGGDRNPLAPGDFLDLRRESRALRRLAAFRQQDVYLSGGGEPEHLRAVQATPDLLATLGVVVERGRGFLPAEGRPGADGVALLSDGFWRRRFAADLRVVGQAIALDERAYTVVGVLPPGFAYPPGGADLWIPLAATEEMASERAALSLRVVGRLDGTRGMATAQAEVETLAARLARAHPTTNAGRGFTLVPLREQQVGVLPPFLRLFQAAAAFVLLIACANVGSLLLARAAARGWELGVRSALGASRSRVVRLLLLESALLSLAGGALGVALAGGGVELIRASLPPDIAKWVAGWREIRVDSSALAFAFLLALATAVLAGLAPALAASRAEVGPSLSDGGRAGTPGPRGRRRRRVLVVAELTLALVLTAGAACLVQGFGRLGNQYQGMEPEGALTFGIRLPDRLYPQPHQVATFYRRLADELDRVTGVESVAFASHLPADLGPVPGGPFTIEDRPPDTPEAQPHADLQTVSPAYFPSLRIALASGRLLGEEDGAEAPPVVVVSESLARRHWPGEDPLGRRLKLGEPAAPAPWLTVVGVVADVTQYWFDREPRPTLYLPHLQAPRRGMFVVLRTAGDPEALGGPARRSVLAVDAAQPIEELRTLRQVVAESLAFVRLAAGLMVSLAALASLLGALGVYGLLGHHVGERTREVGVRMALGASRPTVLRLVLGQAAGLAAVGIAIGLPVALGLGRLLSGALYGLVGADPAVLAAIAAWLAAVALAAGYLPARRAAALDPAAALRRG